MLLKNNALINDVAFSVIFSMKNTKIAAGFLRPPIAYK